MSSKETAESHMHTHKTTTKRLKKIFDFGSIFTQVLTGGFLGGGFGVSTVLSGIHRVGRLPGTNVRRFPFSEKKKKSIIINYCNTCS
jgi:hypothetical protein